VAEDVPVPPPAATEDVLDDDICKVVLDKYLGRHHYNAMTDTYRASFRPGPMHTSVLIIKIVDLQMGGPVPQEAARLATTLKAWHVLDNFQLSRNSLTAYSRRVWSRNSEYIAKRDAEKARART